MAKPEAQVKRSNEIMPKCPPGYRLATVEEEYEIFKLGTVINNADQTIRRCNAEIDRAEMEGQQATRSRKEAIAARVILGRKLGLEGDPTPNDIITGQDGKMAILVDKSKREAALKLLKGGKGLATVKAEKISDGAPPPEALEPKKK
jgi:hypothetical protein